MGRKACDRSKFRRSEPFPFRCSFFISKKVTTSIIACYSAVSKPSPVRESPGIPFFIPRIME